MIDDDWIIINHEIQIPLKYLLSYYIYKRCFMERNFHHQKKNLDLPE